MEKNPVSPGLPLLLLCLTGSLKGVDTDNTILLNDGQAYGPSDFTIMGPEFVTVGVPCTFVCLANCSPPCNYSIGLDGQSGGGNELAFTITQWTNSQTVTCTAQNDVTGQMSKTSKTVRVLVGPANVTISGPPDLTPEKAQNFQCTASCKPSCTYTWKFDGEPIPGSGNEVSFVPPAMATTGVLVCNATNSVSGLSAMAVKVLKQTYGPLGVHISGPGSVRVDSKTQFHCSAICSPSCSFSWTIDGHVENGSDLDITMLKPDTSKVISCQAKNTFSNETADVSRTIQVGSGGGGSLSTRADQAPVLLLVSMAISSILALLQS